MVKNTAGGNKSKRNARKHVNAPVAPTRLKQDSGEMYGCVKKLLGGSICEVLCEDDVERMCVIRNKFRGRGKRDNMIKAGVWVLVGLREWELLKDKKKEKCDLLCVYGEHEKSVIKNAASFTTNLFKNNTHDVFYSKTTQHIDIDTDAPTLNESELDINFDDI